MSNMFFCCENLKNLDLSSFYTKNVVDMSLMFADCDVEKVKINDISPNNNLKNELISYNINIIDKFGNNLNN